MRSIGWRSGEFCAVASRKGVRAWVIDARGHGSLRMTPIAFMVERMLADGVPHAAIILAVQTAEMMASMSNKSADSPVDESADKRRAYDRERQRLKRERLRMSADNPPDSADCPVVTTSFLREDSKKEEKKDSRGSRLSADWKPNSDHYALGSRLGFETSQVDSYALDMRLWAEANAHRPIARKLDWDKTFAGWLRRLKPGIAPVIAAVNGHARAPPTEAELAARREMIERGEKFLREQKS